MCANGIERERKFLVRQVPQGLSRRPHQHIDQGYLATGPPAADEVRIRRAGGQAFLTVKRGRGDVRQEVEVPLPAAAAKRLWPLTKGRRISKTRYLIPSDGVTLQVDVYRGRLRGLVVAEVELPSARALRRFTPPSWVGRELTGRREYSNGALASSGLHRSRPKRPVGR